MVSAIGWQGLGAVDSQKERSVLMDAFDQAGLASVPYNPGHQRGALLAIRLGAEWAAARGIPFLVHSAEDVVPWPNTMQKMIQLFRNGYDYVGSWYCDPPQYDMVNTQFFGAKTDLLLKLNPDSMDRDAEKTMWKLTAGCNRHLLPNADIGRYYATSSVSRCWLLNLRHAESLQGEALETLNDEVVQKRLAAYVDACRQQSDIWEHLPYLRYLATKCGSVVEFGTGRSTPAFLHAQPNKLLSVDLNPSDKVKGLLPLKGRTDFSVLQANDLEIDIEETDMLFIDTRHTCGQLRAELERHSPKIRRWIVLHDTVTFGERGEDGKSEGLWPAVQELVAGGGWKIKEHFTNNNGLTTLERR